MVGLYFPVQHELLVGTVQTSPCNTACKGLAGLSYLHRAWKQHTVALLQWRWGRSLKPSNCLKQLCRAAENSTVKCRGSSFTVPPLLELAQLAQSCLPLPCWPWIAFSTQCSFFQVTDLQIRPEDSMAPFVLCAGASLLLAPCPQCALSLPAAAALSLCCSCWPHKVSHQLGP